MAKNKFLIFPLLVLASQLLGHGLGPTTSVRRNKIRQPIECLFQGNQKLLVSSYDFDEHAIVNSAIKSVGESKTNCYFQVSFDDNPHNDILCTPSQEFYDFRAQHWTPALQLCIGDELLSVYGTYVITSIQFIKKPLKVYAFEIENTHNYFVGSYAILTHNMLLPWALSAGLGISFGAGAAAGGTAGGFFGPITWVGGAVIGGIICAGIKVLADGNRSKYKIYFDPEIIEQKFNPLSDDKIHTPSGGGGLSPHDPNEENEKNKRRDQRSDRELLREIKSLEKRKYEHQVKLNEYIKNPDKFDNKEYLKNTKTTEQRDDIIKRRINHLNAEINTFQNRIQKTSQELKHRSIK